MLKELTGDDWLRLLNVPASRVPAALVLRGTRNLRARYQAALPHFDNVLEVGSPNGIFEDVLIGDLHGRPVGFACVYGAPMASEIVHVFGAMGTRAVILTGNCGALADDLAAGDLFCPAEAFCGEGAAQYYRPGAARVAASPGLVGRLTDAGCRTGHIYTTAALLAEGADDLERWWREGFAAVDMEAAAVFAVAEHFGMDRAAVLYAFDNPRRREHLLLTDAEKDARRAAADARMRELAFGLAVDLSAGREP
jgi:uridine phosphorylase